MADRQIENLGLALNAQNGGGTSEHGFRARLKALVSHFNNALTGSARIEPTSPAISPLSTGHGPPGSFETSSKPQRAPLPRQSADVQTGGEAAKNASPSSRAYGQKQASLRARMSEQLPAVDEEQEPADVRTGLEVARNIPPSSRTYEQKQAQLRARMSEQLRAVDEKQAAERDARYAQKVREANQGREIKEVRPSGEVIYKRSATSDPKAKLTRGEALHPSKIAAMKGEANLGGNSTRPGRQSEHPPVPDLPAIPTMADSHWPSTDLHSNHDQSPSLSRTASVSTTSSTRSSDTAWSAASQSSAITQASSVASRAATPPPLQAQTSLPAHMVATRAERRPQTVDIPASNRTAATQNSRQIHGSFPDRMVAMTVARPQVIDIPAPNQPRDVHERPSSEELSREEKTVQRPQLDPRSRSFGRG